MFDIENYNLKADLGVLLCVGWKVLDKEPIFCPGIWDFKGWKKDLWDDRELVAHVAERFADADAFVTHYGAPPYGHDFRFLNSKLLQYGMKPLPPAKHIDVWKLARQNLTLHSNRQGAVSEFLGTPEKMHPGWNLWKRVMNREPKACREMEKYCRNDVRGLEANFLKLRPFARNIPNQNMLGHGDCPVCGGGPLHRRGMALTQMKKYQRYQCQECGSWSRTDAKDKNPRVA